MANNRKLNLSFKRLTSVINETKTYLEQKNFEIKELERYEKNIKKKFDQFRKDLIEFQSSEEDNSIEKFEETELTAEDILEDLKHYISAENEKQQKLDEARIREEKRLEREAEEKRLQKKAEEKRLEREAEEKRLEREAEEKRLEREAEEERMKREAETKEREAERQFKLELEKLQLERGIQDDKRKHIEAELELRKIEIQRAQPADGQVQNNQRSQPNPTNNGNIRLPKLEFKKFGGDVLKWYEFWDTFDAAINKNTAIPTISKFSYLKAQLEDRALKTIEGLDLTNANYEVAINLLRDRYGKKQFIIDAHYSGLVDLPQAGNNHSSLRITFDNIEKHLRSLEALGENINNRFIIPMIKRKLPTIVLTRLEQQKDTDEEWTLQSLRKAVKGYITAQEVAGSQYNEMYQRGNTNTSRRDNELSKQRDANKGGNQNYRRTTDMLLSTDQMKHQRNSLTCALCNGKHWTDECDLYPDEDSRKKQFQGKCFICLKSGHDARECKVERPCFHCGKTKAHHRSLCPRKFRKPRVNATNSLLASGERVFMQTAKVDIHNLNNKSKSKVVRALLDTGSQRSYITEELSNKLELPISGKEIYSVYTFGSKKPKDVKTATVSLGIASNRNDMINITASVVPVITGSVSRTPITSKSYERILEYELADIPPTCEETSEIDLLIGNDYYGEIMLQEKIEIDKGLFLCESKLGWILSGRTFSGNTDYSLSMLSVTSGSIYNHLTNKDLEFEQPVTPNIEDFWSLETIGMKEKTDHSDDEIALENFRATVSFKEGRYHVSWPWKETNKELPDNYALAYGRLRSNVANLAKDLIESVDNEKTRIKEKYSNEIDDIRRNMKSEFDEQCKNIKEESNKDVQQFIEENRKRIAVEKEKLIKENEQSLQDLRRELETEKENAINDLRESYDQDLEDIKTNLESEHKMKVKQMQQEARKQLLEDEENVFKDSLNQTDLQSLGNGLNATNEKIQREHNEQVTKLIESKKQANIRSDRIPMQGEVVQIKDNVTRGTWKIGRIKELIRNKDKKITAAKIILPSKTIIQRSLCHLFPLECDDMFLKQNSEYESLRNHDTDSICSKILGKVARPKRKYAMEARDKIYALQFEQNSSDQTPGGSVANIRDKEH